MSSVQRHPPAAALPSQHVNMFAGSPLNRLSWLRTSHHFLNAIIALPTTQWLLFNAGKPLVISDPSSQPRLAFLTTAEIQSLLGPQPFFGQGQQLGTLIPDEINNVPHSVTECARHHPESSLRIIFLGVHERQPNADVSTALPISEFTSPDVAVEAIKKLDGTPYFAVDMADGGLLTEVKLQAILQESSERRGQQAFVWSEPRALVSDLDQFTGAVFACARSLADWNYRNKFCPGCGSKTYSMWGGWKISCSSLLPWADNTGKSPCPSGKGLHNYTHPRTDPVVIMIAIDETGNKVLLGRGRRWSGKFYSAFAGFIEPGESFEDAVSREMWEEAGVRVWNIRYHSAQPWPYPANLMVGFYARADSRHPIRTDLDNELIDARWFTKEEILSVINHPTGTRLTRADYKKAAEYTEGKGNDDQTIKTVSPPESLVEETPFKLPPITAIAGVLLRHWVDGKIGFEVHEQGLVPNL